MDTADDPQAVSDAAHERITSLLFNLSEYEDRYAIDIYSGYNQGAFTLEEATREAEHHGRLACRLADMDAVAANIANRSYIDLRCLHMVTEMYGENNEHSETIANLLGDDERALLAPYARAQAESDKRRPSEPFADPGAMERLRRFFEEDPRARGKRGRPSYETLGGLMDVSDVTAKRYLSGERRVSRCAAANLMLSIGTRDYRAITEGKAPARREAEKQNEKLRRECAGKLSEIEDVQTLGTILIIIEALAARDVPSL